MPRPKSFDETAVLTQAMLVFWRRGYDATSIKSLERATGLGASSLYHAFGSKEAFFARVLRHYLSTVIETRVQLFLGPSHEPLEGIRQFLLTSVEGVPSPLRGHACLLVNTAAEVGEEVEAVAPVLGQGLEIVRAGFLEQLARAQQAGQIEAHRDLEALASHLLLFMTGFLVVSRIDRHREELLPLIEGFLEAFSLGQTSRANIV